MLLMDYLEIERQRLVDTLQISNLSDIHVDDLGGVQRAKRDIDTPVLVINWTTDNIKADSNSHAVRISINLLLALPRDNYVTDGRFNDNNITDLLGPLGYELVQAGNYNESLQIELLFNKIGVYVKGD